MKAVLRLVAIATIFLLTSVAWAILGGVMMHRADT
jgi:hypothetical protein